MLPSWVQVNACSIPKASVIRRGSAGKVVIKKDGCISYFNSEIFNEAFECSESEIVIVGLV